MVDGLVGHDGGSGVPNVEGLAQCGSIASAECSVSRWMSNESAAVGPADKRIHSVYTRQGQKRMHAMPGKSSGKQTRAVNLRMRDDVRALIDRAAKANGQSRSDFMITAACRAAEDALVTQTFIQVDAETLDRYRAILDAPPAGDGYERLMRAERPWRS